MKISIAVFIKDFSRYRTGAVDKANNTEYWDLDGASETIDKDIVAFPVASFAVPSKPSNGYVVTDKSGAYKWTVSVASFAQIEALKITKFPTIIFINTDTNTVVGRLEGSPYSYGSIAAVLKQIFATGAGSGSGNGSTTGGGLSSSVKKGFQWAALAGLALFAIKKNDKKNGTTKRKTPTKRRRRN